MVNTANQAYRISAGSAFLYAVHMVNVVTKADFIQEDISTITENVTDTKTGVVTSRELAVKDVVFDTLQTDATIEGGTYQYNLLVLVPSTAMPHKRRYHYQLELVPKDDQGEPALNWTQKTEEIDIVCD